MSVLFLAYSLLISGLGCGDNYFGGELVALDPAEAYEGQEVIITGTDLGGSSGGKIILTAFDDLSELDISEASISWSHSEVTFTVPPALENQDFVLHVERDGLPTNRLRFDIILPPDPTVTVVSPPAGQVGDALTITGTDFGVGQGSVLFWPSNSGSVTAWSDTEITVQIPDIMSTDSLRVERANGFLSTWFPFTVADPSVPSLSLIQNTIFTPRCTNGACHGSGESGELGLLPGQSYGNLVSVESRLDGVMRVVPFQPDASLLIDKLENASPAIGVQMPLTGQLLQQEQIDLIRAWINEGAPNN